jgi:hypothetical protein
MRFDAVGLRTRGGAGALAPAEAAWLAAVPCALLILAGIVLVGPVLGHAFLAPGSDTFWPGTDVRPEPVEHGRYLVALLGAPLLAAAVLASSDRPSGIRPETTRRLVAAAQALGCAFLVLCLLAQNDVIFRSYVPPAGAKRIFSLGTLVAAAVLPLLALALARQRGVGARVGQAASETRLARAARETRPRRVAGLVLAAACTAAWLLTALNSDATIGSALGSNLIPWDMSETYAVLDGRTPLVDFHAQYAQLWPYVPAAIMALAGSSTIAAWTAIMASISGLALLAVYAVLRRILRSSLLALVLYVPLLATGFFIAEGTAANRFSPAGIFSLWPMRYAGPYLVAWLTARHLDRVAPRRAWLLLLAAGLVALNNLEFGLGAFAGTVVALALQHPPRSRRAVLRQLARAAGGLLGAGLLVAALTLARTGSLPHVPLLLEFPRIYGVGGWSMGRMPPLGFHVVLYLTFTAAIVTAVVRAARGGGGEAVLTSMLAWSGTFGLIAGSYYIGASDALNLIALFSAWCFALMLLVVVVARSLTARAWRRPRLAELAVLYGFGLALCSLPQLPVPWSQVARLQRHAPPILAQTDAKRFVARTTRPGEQVGILIPLGFRIAYELGLTDVAPYASIESMPTAQQLQRTIATLRHAHARKLFVATEATLEPELQALAHAGFRPRRTRGSYEELVDAGSGSR